MKALMSNIINIVKNKIGIFLIAYLLFFINFIDLFALNTGYVGRIIFILLILFGNCLFMFYILFNLNKAGCDSLKIFILLSICFYTYVIINGVFNQNLPRLFYGGYQYIIYYMIFFSTIIFLPKNKIDKFLAYLLSFNFVISLLHFYEYFSKTNLIPNEGPGNIAYEGVLIVRAKAFFGSFLNSGVALAITCFIAIYFIIKSIKNKSRLRSIIYSIYLISYIIAIVFTGSRGPLVSLAIGLFISLNIYVFMISNNRKRWCIILCICIVLILVLIFILININIDFIDNESFKFIIHRMQSIFDWNSDKGNVQRLESWNTAISLISGKYIFGIGVASTGAKGLGEFSIGVTESGILKKFVEMGIVGLILTYSFYVLIFKRALSYIKKSSSYIDKIFIALLIGILVTVITEEFIYQSLESEVVAFYLWSMMAILYIKSNTYNSLY